MRCKVGRKGTAYLLAVLWLQSVARSKRIGFSKLPKEPIVSIQDDSVDPSVFNAAFELLTLEACGTPFGKHH